MFLSDEGPTLETLDIAFYIGSTPTFLFFDLYLNTAYAAISFLLWRRSYARKVSSIHKPEVSLSAVYTNLIINFINLTAQLWYHERAANLHKLTQ